jgi:hypothetical protein
MGKNILVIFFLFLSTISSADKAPFKKYFTNAKVVSRETTYLTQQDAKDFWNLMPFYRGQITSSACSLAVFTHVVNAMNSLQSENGEAALLTQQSLLKKIKDKKYAAVVAEGGGGIGLSDFTSTIKKHLPKLSPHSFRVEMYRSLKSDPLKISQLEELLIENERNPNNFIIVNFIQSALTGDPEGAVGHYSVVGAYNSSTQRVLVFDPDREYYEPYWVSLDLLHKGITEDVGKLPAAEYTRGYIKIELLE